MKALIPLSTGSILTTLCCLSLGLCVQANAAIHVGVGCSGSTGDSAGLVDAINLANAEGGGTIELSASCTYTFTQIDNYWYGPNALPPIQSAITIDGKGAVLQASHVGDPIPATANAFRFFYVSGGMESPAGSLNLQNLTLRGGYAKGGDSSYGGGGAGMGGAIFNQGTVALSAVTLTGNSAQGGNISGDSVGGGGMGQDGDASGFGYGGGFGATSLPGAYSPLSSGGSGANGGGGGGGGFLPGDNGLNSTTNLGAAGGGHGGLGGGSNGDGGTGAFSIGGGSSSGGGFGSGGRVDEVLGTFDGGGGGGVGGGGGGAGCDGLGGGGGFGGGGGVCGIGGFGGGGGYDAGNHGGFGGGGSEGVPAGAGAGMGGAIFNHTGSVRLINATLTGNAAKGGSANAPGSGLGAAIFNLNGTVEISFSTIAQNAVSGSNGQLIGAGPGDGAIYSLAYGNDILDGSGSGAVLTVVNSIVTGTAGATSDVVNNSVNGLNTNVSGLTFAGGNIIGAYSNYSFVDGNSSAPSNADPLLGALSPYAGAVPTLPIAQQSPADNAAASCNDADGNPVTVDARGVARPQNGQCDIGAYEYDGDYIFANSFE